MLTGRKVTAKDLRQGVGDSLTQCLEREEDGGVPSSNLVTFPFFQKKITSRFCCPSTSPSSPVWNQTFVLVDFCVLLTSRFAYLYVLCFFLLEFLCLCVCVWERERERRVCCYQVLFGCGGLKNSGVELWFCCCCCFSVRRLWCSYVGGGSCQSLSLKNLLSLWRRVVVVVVVAPPPPPLVVSKLSSFVV